MTKANECTCPSGDGSLRHPCPAHPASVDLAGVAAKLTFINGRPAMCGCQVEYSSGGGEYSDVIDVTLCAKHSGSAILDLVATNRIALTPEYEGQWHADLYLDREIPLAKAEGATPAEAVLALMSAERIDPEQGGVDQAGGDRWDALQSIMEWTAAENIPDDRKLCLIRNAARAALAQPSPAQAEQAEAEAERPEVFGLERYRVERTGQGFWPYCVRAGDGTRELFVGHLKQCKRVAAQLATAFEDGKFVAGALRAELETERMRLAGCGVAALGYFDGCADAYKSASLSDVLRLRADCDAALARVAELEAKLSDPMAVHQWQFSNAWFDGSEEVVLKAGKEGSPIRTLYTAPVAQAQHSVPGNAAALVRAEAKKYSLNAAGMLDSGAPEHAQTFAIVQLLSEFDDEEAESHWEAIMAYSDFRTSDALFRAAELLAAAPGKEGV
ncbi:hypothetical protein V4W74_01925 [Pseudomonas aeruginosa]|uniref:hypothetical protein n=1 Tax=Pseudomonas aeruginosa TaxID=287 RepID=UPI0032E433C0